MYKYGIDLPANTRRIVLPDNPDIVIFAATLAAGMPEDITSASPLYRTSIVNDANTEAFSATAARESLVNAGNIIEWSGYVNNEEKPEFMHDGDHSTKWCDTSGIPSHVDYDLGTPRKIKGWTLTGAGVENPSYITSTCLLQTRNNLDEEWHTADAMLSNKQNRVNRVLNSPVTARYVRLMVVQPEQTVDGHVTRIYEFVVY